MKKLITIAILVTLTTLSLTPIAHAIQNTDNTNKLNISDEEISDLLNKTNLTDDQIKQVKGELEILISYEPSININQVEKYIGDFENNATNYSNSEKTSLESNQLTTQEAQSGVIVRVFSLVFNTAKRLIGKLGPNARYAIVELTAHVSEQALARAITPTELDDLLTNGARYVDDETGARIVHNPKRGIAAVIDKSTDTVITVLNKRWTVKTRWTKSLWFYKDELD